MEDRKTEDEFDDDDDDDDDEEEGEEDGEEEEDEEDEEPFVVDGPGGAAADELESTRRRRRRRRNAMQATTTAAPGNRAKLWVILATTATLIGRRILTTGFPYPICFVLLIQVATYLGIALTLLFVRLREIRGPKRKCVSERPRTWLENLVIVLRLLFHFIIATAATICGAEALRHYNNLPVLAILPILTYVMDGLLFRFAGALRLVQLDQGQTKMGLLRLFLSFSCILLAVYEDYRLNVRGLLFAVTSYTLVSLAKLNPRIGPRIDNGSVHTWDCPLYVHLLIGVPPMIITTYAARKFEDIGLAFSIAWSWGGWGLLSSLAPGALLFIVFQSSMNEAYPFSMVPEPGLLEHFDSQARTAISATLQASFWITCMGVFLGEHNLVDWMQVLAFVLLYVVGAGTRQIGFYPPRLLNLIARVLRKPQQKIRTEPWQLPFFLWTTISIFVALLSSILLYWSVNVAYARDLKNWAGLESISLDSVYIPPQPHLFDIVIAHSEGDPLESISDLIATFATLEAIQDNVPQVKIYTKDQALSATDFSNITGSFTGPLTAVILHNSGGVAATFLHHILYSWDFVASQTLFLSTSSPHLSTIQSRFNSYFIPALPIHSTRIAGPVTSFLNLGDYSTCNCDSCSDSMGWRDTFHLIPSMFGAAHPEATCKSVLLTYGNNFVVSADRIRGIKRDVWQMLYDALVTENLRNSWAHSAEKVPSRTGEDGQEVKWVFGEEDSVENPYLGYTIERLWGVLLQCSSVEVAWKCPDTGRGWRRGGTDADCGCLHW